MATTTTTTSKMLAGHAQLPSEDGRRSARSASSYHSAASYRSADHSGNPYHTYQPAAAHAGEIHLLNMPDDALRVVPGDARAHKLGLSAFQRHPDDRPVTPVGPPPPSPPASVHRVPLVESPEEVNLSTPMSDPLRAPTWLDTTTSVTEDESPVAGPSRAPEHEQPRTHFAPPSAATAPIFRRSMTSEVVRANDSSASSVRSTPSRARPAGADDVRAAHLSVDGFLQPPAAGAHRPTRRNTTGALAGRPAHAAGASAPEDGALAEADELAGDIELQAAQIRLERRSKRAKAQAAEQELMRVRSVSDGEKVLVGNVIREGHANYVLMYNMLSGIRLSVSRCQAKLKRPLTDDDFTAKHKYSFDVLGNELTPATRYDFKFKDYAPAVFRELREDSFMLDPSDYLMSLTDKYILSELGSPGKSGSFFYFSRDYRFIIKTIHHSEHKFLRRVLPQYYEHVRQNPHTLLSRFYGLHRVKLPRGHKIHFVIMNNLFPPHKDVHETYDLKGSTIGREYPEARAAENPRAVLKDLNWIHRSKELEIGPERRALLTEQLRRDAELLKHLHVMDYSLLVGIHNATRGNRDNVRRNTLKVYSAPSAPPMRRQPTQGKGSKSPEAVAMRNAMHARDPKRLLEDAGGLDGQDAAERSHFVFYQDDGGLRATDEANAPLDTIYYLGVIDILTPYSTKKKLENIWKGLKADRHKISPVPPTEYADRFFSFMKAIMRGGGGGESFAPKAG